MIILSATIHGMIQSWDLACHCGTSVALCLVPMFGHRWRSFVRKAVLVQAEVADIGDQHNDDESAAEDTVWWHLR